MRQKSVNLTVECKKVAIGIFEHGDTLLHASQLGGLIDRHEPLTETSKTLSLFSIGHEKHWAASGVAAGFLFAMMLNKFC